MNMKEFCDRAGIDMVEDEANWQVIQTVYTYHPIISDVNGKDEIADLFKRGGIGILRDMYQTADEIRRHESNIQYNNVALEKLEKERKEELEAIAVKYATLTSEVRNNTIAANDRLREINESFAICK
jgi:hypothetical protein